jgi:hypothetical protein
MKDEIGFQNFIQNLFSLYKNNPHLQEYVLHLLALSQAHAGKIDQAISMVTD